MHSNNTNNRTLLYPELSYVLVGIFYDVHNTLGRYAKEKQYCDAIEEKLKSLGIRFQRELLGTNANRYDFLVDEKIIIEVKAKRFILKDDYYQTQRYLQHANIKLGLLVNFRNRYLKPLRIIKIETDHKNKFFDSYHSH